MKTGLLVVAGFIAGLGIVCWLQRSSEPPIEIDQHVTLATPAAELSTPLDAAGNEPFGVPLARENGSDPPFIDRAPLNAQDQRLAVDLIVAGFAPASKSARCVLTLATGTMNASSLPGTSRPASTS